MKEPFNIAAYVAKTTKASGVPLRVSGSAVLAIVVRLLTK